jgi:PadR family transcriptional regulator
MDIPIQQRGWIASNWGTSENNRKAKYYSITKSGRKQLARECAFEKVDTAGEFRK